jgi:hypothetical protein
VIASRLDEGPVQGPAAAQDDARGTTVRPACLRRGGGGASRGRPGGTGVCGDPRADGVGCDAPGGVQQAEGAHLHAARWQDRWEETGHTLKAVEASGAWPGPACFAGGEGDEALVPADDAPGGAGTFADIGRQGWQGGGARGSGLAVDVPWGRPDVGGDLCKLSGRVPLVFEARAGDRGQRPPGDRAVGSRRPPGLALLGAATARDAVMHVGRRGQWSPPGRQETRKAGQRRADEARGVGKAFERLERG